MFMGEVEIMFYFMCGWLEDVPGTKPSADIALCI